MATLIEGKHAGEFLVSEGNGWISREAVTILSGQNLAAGTVLGQIEVGSASSEAGGNNTGNGTLGAVTVGAGAQPGAYLLAVTAAAANAGSFQVTDPQGDVVGMGAVGVAFNGGGLSFTLADGAADFAVGDQFTITVAEGSKKYIGHDPSGADGRQHAKAVLFEAVDASAGDQPGVAIARYAEVNGDEIVWKTGIGADDKAAGIAALKNIGIVVR
jgi:hypothetical protein